MIMIFDELCDAGYLTIVEEASVLEYCIAIASDEELGGPAFGEFAVLGIGYTDAFDGF